MRKYLPTTSELIDRLSIVQLKEVFIPEHKKEYAKEIKDIVHDLEGIGIDGEMIRAIIVLAQMNLHIWHNETKYRAGEGDGNLGLTHGLNGIRNTAKNKIQDSLEDGGRKDYKKNSSHNTSTFTWIASNNGPCLRNCKKGYK